MVFSARGSGCGHPAKSSCHCSCDVVLAAWLTHIRFLASLLTVCVQMFEKQIVIDGRGHLLGRLASTVAKELIGGTFLPKTWGVGLGICSRVSAAAAVSSSSLWRRAMRLFQWHVTRLLAGAVVARLQCPCRETQVAVMVRAHDGIHAGHKA